jgi:hypothetical protein
MQFLDWDFAMLGMTGFSLENELHMIIDFPEAQECSNFGPSNVLYQ